MHKWHKDLRGKTSSRRGGKNHGCGPTGPRKLHYEQPRYRVFSRTSRDMQHTQYVANRQQQQQPLEGRLQQSRDITVSVPFNNQQTALKPQHQTTPNLADKQTYVFPTISPNFSSIAHHLLPKLFVYQNCLFWNCSSPNCLNHSQIWCYTDSNLKPANQIEVLKVTNELTKYGVDPSTFEPPNTSLKIDRSDLRNLDRNHLSFFFLSSH